MSDSTSQELATGQHRERSKNFTQEETSILIELLEQHRQTIFDTNINAAAVYAKECAWVAIADQYSQLCSTPRTPDTLKYRWGNLRRQARKCTNNYKDICYSQYDPVMSRVIALVSEATLANKSDSATDTTSHIESKSVDNKELWTDYDDDFGDNDNSRHSEPDGERQRESRSLNFTPQECNLLLQCVKREKKIIFSKDNSAASVQLRNEAWERITEAFNKGSAHHRPLKNLKIKFENMKKMARNVVTTQKTTPKKSKDFGVKQVFKKEKEDSMDYDDLEEPFPPDFDILHTRSESTPDADPLSIVLNGYTESDMDQYREKSSTENAEIVKLKTELLNYQLETARLDRQRVQAALDSEQAERATRARLLALQLREARLNTRAAEQKFPLGHPALDYLPEEMYPNT